MLMSVNSLNRHLFEAACAFERVMGSKCLNSLECFGEGHPDARFLLSQRINGDIAGALYHSGSVLVISAGDLIDPSEIAEYVVHNEIREIDTNFDLASRLQSILGGELESSCFMAYRSAVPPESDFSAVTPYKRLEDVFMVLQQSHEYYRSHFRYGSWAADARLRLRAGCLELYQLDVDGEPAGTGSVASRDDECGVVAAVAVVPEYRGRGLGTLLSSFLTRRILELGKTPRLLSSYDEVAELYRKIGYRETGRWGELYL